MEAYRRNIDTVIANDTEDTAEKETLIFNEYIDKFQHFYKDEDDLELPNGAFEDDPDIIDTLPASDTISPDNTKTDILQDTVGMPLQQ